MTFSLGTLALIWAIGYLVKMARARFQEPWTADQMPRSWRNELAAGRITGRESGLDS